MATVTDRVRSLIGQLGLTQREFAERVGLDNSKMSKSFAGVRRFSSLDLARMAEVGGVSVDWLLTGVEPELGLAARVSRDSGVDRAASEARRLADARANLAFLGYPQPWRPIKLTSSGGYEIRGAAVADEALRRMADHGMTLVGADLPEIVESVFGADVAVKDLGSGFDGLSVITQDAKLILVSRSSVPWRQRFTIAHELGHLLAGDDQGLHVDVDIFDRDHGRLDTERGANAFATSFLMPEPVLRRAVGDHGLTPELFAGLSAQLRVSPSALAFRLHRLRLIDAYASKTFREYTAHRVASMSGKIAELAADIAQAQRERPPGVLIHDAFAAYAAGDTSIIPYADLLGVDPEELRSSLESGDYPDNPT